MCAAPVEHARILIADDDTAGLRILARILERAGFAGVHTTCHGLDVPRLFAEHAPDMVVLDLHLGSVDGTEVMRQLQRLIPPGTYLPILIVSGDLTDDARLGALRAGAMDFISKPYRMDEVLLRVRNHLRTRDLHLAVARQNQELEARVLARTLALEETAWEVLERLARAAELRDDDTGTHTRRVGDLSGRLAAAVGLPAAEAEMIRRTAPLHDLGKIGIPDCILRKPGLLTDDERARMQQHTLIGAQILSAGTSEMVRTAAEIALSHHERWDGSGYPHGTAGESIPLPARIVAVADVFDALSSDRPYRPAWPLQRILKEIAGARGSHFDPRIVDAFMAEVVPALPGPPVRTTGC